MVTVEDARILTSVSVEDALSPKKSNFGFRENMGVIIADYFAKSYFSPTRFDLWEKASEADGYEGSFLGPFRLCKNLASYVKAYNATCHHHNLSFKILSRVGLCCEDGIQLTLHYFMGLVGKRAIVRSGLLNQEHDEIEDD